MREGRIKKTCVDHILLKSLTTNVDLRTSLPPSVLGKRIFEPIIRQ